MPNANVSSTNVPTLTANARGRRWLQGGHPWLFLNDIAAGDPTAALHGGLVRVEGPSGECLGQGLFSRASKIRVRLVTRGELPVDRDFWRERVARAVGVRARLGLLDPRGACRLLGGDAEGFPGFVADRYGDVLVVQSGTAGGDRLRDLWVEALLEALPWVGRVLDRSDSSVRRLEQLEPRVELLRGAIDGPVEVREGDLLYEVDVRAGHKTGHYLDQRDNRARAALFARGVRCLDVFSYDGLFGVRAALAGATSVLCLDQAPAAGQRALANAVKNGVGDRVSFERVDAMGDLRQRVRRGERYGLVVLDPPAFARNRRELEGALRGYRELNLRGMELLEPGGMLVTASCSHAMGEAEFVHCLREAAAGAGRSAYLVEMRGAAADHPALLTLPESSYLKCAFVRVE
ncbi:MAG: class I SAM-dependent rRNA methyltransferase [Planctomycetes bacterium]|nr:class I SAM-dependent rRNA methyltransferase [Planctomycetota bacterium]